MSDKISMNFDTLKVTCEPLKEVPPARTDLSNIEHQPTVTHVDPHQPTVTEGRTQRNCISRYAKRPGSLAFDGIEIDTDTDVELEEEYY